MEELRTVTATGDVRIPAVIRKKLGLESGDQVVFEVAGHDKVFLRKTPKSERQSRSRPGLLDAYAPRNVGPVDLDDMQRVIEEAAVESAGR